MARGVKGTAGLQCSVEGCHRPPAPDRTAPSGYRSCCAEHAAERNRLYRQRRMEAAGVAPRHDEPQFSAPDLPEDLPPIDELRERRTREWSRRSRAHDARRCIDVQIHAAGPIGLLCLGDLHVDDPGCNWPLLERHTQLAVETDGLYCAAVGDLQNAWVGRLARLYGNQSTSAREAWALVEWWTRAVAEKLVFISAGNHDAWARTVNNIDPLAWIASQQGTIYGNNGARVALCLPDGERIVINCRHDFTGRSQYNPAHGVVKAAMFGHRDDLLLAGHTHQFGYSPIKCPSTGKVSHAIRLASYKVIDEYALERGFPDANVSEACVAIYDPLTDDPRHRIHIDFNVERGAWTLTKLREEWQRRQQPPSAPARKRKAA